MDDLAGKRVVVMGLGRFGGGIGVARYLHRQGADVLVTDLAEADELRDSLAELDDLELDYRLGEHNVSDFTTADLVVVNPAVDRRDNRFLRAADAAGVPLTSEMRLLVEAACTGDGRNRVIAVTGTAGKSTTVAMIGHILEQTTRAWVGGNIGGSLLGCLDEIGDHDWLVIELSSFMLEELDPLAWSPHVAVVTNLSDNHLDRHGDMASYAAAKQVILRHQTDEDIAVLGANVADWAELTPGQVVVVDQPRQRLALLVPGEHNRLNATMAIAAAEAAGVEAERAAELLQDFAGLPHRLQLVADHNDIRFFNDSKSTTPTSAWLAIHSFEPGRVHLIAGGYDKQADLTGFARQAAARCAAIYTLGQTGDAIAEAAETRHDRCPVHRCGELEPAVRTAIEHARPGDVVLLSPACASWDQFDSFEQRGRQFAEHVLRYATPD